MKRLLYIVWFALLTMPMMAGIHSYTDTSVLSSGKWVKIRVASTGVCRMSFSQLQQAGLNPQELRVFGYGGAMLEQSFLQPKIDDLPQVPVFVGDDYVLFWVQANISWKYSDSEARFVHTRNTYSDYGYYFLTDNVGELMPLPLAEEVAGTPTDLYTYTNLQVHELDSVNLIDRNGISGGGRDFYGELFTSNRSRIFTFNTPNAVEGGQSTVLADVAAYASNDDGSIFMATYNGTSSASVSLKKIPDHYTMGIPGTIRINSTATTANQQRVQLTLQNSTAGALGWLNYIELVTPCSLAMSGDWMTVRSTTNYKTSTPIQFHLTGTTAETQIWDITDRAAIKRIPTTFLDDELRWIGSQEDAIHEYVAVNTNGSKWVSAHVVGTVKNQNLHDLKNIDYVIICQAGYEAYAEELAKAHEEKQSITYAIVTEEQVFNEFSSGTPDATAYRWLMKMLYDRAGGANIKPRWLLLMGHGTFDNRKLLPNSGARILLTYQAKNSTNEVNAYTTDDYFAFLEDKEGESDTQGTMDIGVGRLPVSTTTEAQQVVAKLTDYIRNDSTHLGKWKNQLIFLADDGDNGTHTETSEKSAELTRMKNPNFVVHKIFLDAYPQEVNASGESYPLAKNKLDNLLKNGVLFFDFSGHASAVGITNESILSLRDIEKMNNRNLAFWLFVTCNFGQCDAGKTSAAEASILNPNGGSVGIFTATRTVYATGNTTLNRAVCDTLFGHTNPCRYEMTIGEAIAAGKNRLTSDANKMSYVLLGDPAIRLNYPTDYQVETTTQMDTLNALDVQHVEGQVVDEDKQLVADFNGQVDITIYDKMQLITTRDNDADPSSAKTLTYKDYPNTIFTGSAPVKDGLFNYTFMVPKDIRYNFGNGRIVYYARMADSTGYVAEAVGHFEDFVIGGTGSIFVEDTIGPEMTIYLNSPSFKDGDKTYETPRFFANLSDEHGINTAGAGIGHDLMLIIDDDPNKTYSLNNYFTAQNNSYQAGQVSYLMEKLADGSHSLLFRAWDMLNNSTTKTLNFIVQTGLDPSISSVTTYPNPVQAAGTINLIVDYNQPDELLQTDIYLYNINGQLVWSRTQNNPDQVSISLPSLGLEPGIYVYSVRIKSASSKYSTSSGKIIVTK